MEREYKYKYQIDGYSDIDNPNDYQTFVSKFEFNLLLKGDISILAVLIKDNYYCNSDWDDGVFPIEVIILDDDCNKLKAFTFELDNERVR